MKRNNVVTDPSNKKPNKIGAYFTSPSGKSVIASLVCILIGLLVGLLVMIIITLVNNPANIGNAFVGLLYLIRGPFGSNIGANMISNMGNMIFYAVPLIFTGLAIAIAYKTGLFNIGTPGQFTMGTIGCLTVALSLHTDNGFVSILIWLLAVLFGTLLGALWGLIPGLFKAYFNINEVIVGIMTNWIAGNICTWYFSSIPAFQSTSKGGYTATITSGTTPTFGLDKLFSGSMMDGGIIFAIIAAVVIFIILNKTKLGFELKACGFNKNASKYAGLNEKKNIILSMVISGGLAAMGACFYYLNTSMEFKFDSAYQSLPSYGFNGIASAFLASCNPVGTIFSSLFIRWLNMGGEYLTKAGFNRYMADIIVAVIVYLAGFSKFIGEVIDHIREKKKKKLELAMVDANANPAGNPNEEDHPTPELINLGDSKEEVKAEEPAVQPVTPDTKPDEKKEATKKEEPKKTKKAEKRNTSKKPKTEKKKVSKKKVEKEGK